MKTISIIIIFISLLILTTGCTDEEKAAWRKAMNAASQGIDRQMDIERGYSNNYQRLNRDSLKELRESQQNLRDFQRQHEEREHRRREREHWNKQDYGY